jgi:hypothetical protein
MSKHVADFPGSDNQFIVAPVAVPVKTVDPSSRPEFIRPPKRGLCPWSGLSRAKIYELIHSGRVKSVCLRKPGATRGARLIHLQSLLSYLHSLAD